MEGLEGLSPSLSLSLSLSFALSLSLFFSRSILRSSHPSSSLFLLSNGFLVLWYNTCTPRSVTSSLGSCPSFPRTLPAPLRPNSHRCVYFSFFLLSLCIQRRPSERREVRVIEEEEKRRREKDFIHQVFDTESFFSQLISHTTCCVLECLMLLASE